MQMHLPSPGSPDPRTVLWISPVDDEKIPADPVFLDAAQRIGIDFFLYRARELNDPSRTSELIERAVHCASRAQKKQPVRDPAGYLWCTFTRLVERELSRAPLRAAHRRNRIQCESLFL
jgi:hypothetical protein